MRITINIDIDATDRNITSRMIKDGISEGLIPEIYHTLNSMDELDGAIALISLSSEED